jgi:hypothetical protein
VIRAKLLVGLIAHETTVYIIGHEAGGERAVQGVSPKAFDVFSHVINPRLPVCYGLRLDQPARTTNDIRKN